MGVGGELMGVGGELMGVGGELMGVGGELMGVGGELMGVSGELMSHGLNSRSDKVECEPPLPSTSPQPQTVFPPLSP
jgi:hypothetical protein